MPDDVQVLEGRVERLVFRNPDSGFAVVRLLPSGGRAVTVAGVLGDVETDDELRAVGRFEDHPRFGRRFSARSAHRVSPRTLHGIERYLSGPRVKGIGPELARRLVATFGTSTLEILDDHPERLTEVPGIGEGRARQIADTWREEVGRREMLVFLQGHGLGPQIAARVLETLGADALTRVRDDPYLLVERVAGVGFRTADAMGRAAGLDPAAPQRLHAGLVHLLDQACFAGHLGLPGEELLERACDLLDVPAAPVRSALRDMVEDGQAVIARPAVSRAGGDDRYMVYLRFAFDAEREAAERLRAHVAAADPLGARIPDHVPPDPHGRLTDEQERAIATVLGAKVSVLTGGPGVGKTTVLRRLVELWRAHGVRVALACPTGRAAKRLEEVSGLEAKTLHRLLKFDAKKRAFAHGEDFKLRTDVVVVDETSMLDLPLFLHLLRSLAPDTRLLLVGDADQLPSVGPGLVLRDLVASDLVPVVRLTRVFRQAGASGIVRLAHAVLEGHLDWPLDAPDVFFIEREDPAEAAALIPDLVLRRIPERFDLSGAQDVQVLAPMHKGPTGTREINRAIQDARSGEAGEAVIRLGEMRFQLGDRVMQVRNDYDRELFNGDVGWVIEVRADTGRLVADFGGARHEFTRDQLGDLQPAWAISVHKSQGGEYPAVLLPLFTQHYLLLQRQVLYTAVTRSRRLLVILGSRRALELAVANNTMAQRYGHLCDWLGGAEPDVWAGAQAAPGGGLADPNG